jgi:radical SAM superfamily enzyme YgiQ (UPF0313 family)
MVDHGKIVLNCMPPAMPTMASAGLSSLKGFLAHHGLDSEIVYWNIEVFKMMLPYFKKLKTGQAGVKDSLFVLPFLYDIALEHKDPVAKSRIHSFFSSLFPKDMLTKDCEVILNSLRDGIRKAIDAKYCSSKEEDFVLFGFSSKFHQWIPGSVMAGEFKQRYPNVKTVIGGFGSSNEAIEVLRVCPNYDFAIWGEGEYPLLALCKELKKNTPDFKKVPQLVYRYDGEFLLTKKCDQILSMDCGIQPDYCDIFKTVGDKANLLQFPIVSSRGCHWNRCKFCYFGSGAKYRKKSIDKTILEIEQLYLEHGITSFRFVDLDVVGRSVEEFEALLDAIIASRERTGGKYDFYAEIVQSGFSAHLVSKLALAGFCEVQIGYEAVTDELLDIAGKKSDFASNLLFVKFAKKYGVKIIGANILRGMVGETEQDVLRSSESLAYLRFYLCRKPGGFWHNLSDLRLQGGTRFFKMVGEEEQKQWNRNPMAYLLPRDFFEFKNRFGLFDFTKELEHLTEWKRFERINDFYEKAGITCSVTKKDDAFLITEYLEREPYKKTALKPNAWDVLKVVNDEVRDLNDVVRGVQAKHPALTQKRCVQIITDLKTSQLLYANQDMTRIVSIIDTECID